MCTSTCLNVRWPPYSCFGSFEIPSRCRNQARSGCLWDSAGTVTLGAEAGDDVGMDHALCDELSLFTLFIPQILFIVWEQSPRVGGGGAYTSNNYKNTADRTCVAGCEVSN